MSTHESGPSPEPAVSFQSGGDATAAVRELVDSYWEHLLELDPLLATQVGDDRFDDRLPDPSAAGLAREREVHEGVLARAAEIDRAPLDAEDRINLDLAETIARRGLDALDHRLDRFAPATHLFGPATLLADIASMQRADTPERLELYLGRLHAFPRYLGALEDVLREAAEAGQTVPALVADRALALTEAMLRLPVEESPALSNLRDDQAARRRAIGILTDDVLPAFGRYLDALRAYRPAARDTIGMSALPGGEEMYASQIRAYTTLPLDPREVHGIGVRELERIQDQRRAIATRLGFEDAGAAIAARQASGQNIASSREELVRLAEEYVQKSWAAAPRYFGHLPRANCEVRPVEEYREQHMPPAFYQPPTADGSRSGVYYINAGDLEGMPLHSLAAITYHEANPGHHFQLSIEQEFSDRPALRRFGGILAGSAAAEGWGLYCERLADEMGLYENEYDVLGMLDAQGWRANRLVVDTGIHALGWSRERAIEQMLQAGPARGTAENEVDRYIAWPGQALAYMIGQLEVQRWRAEAEEREGQAFSLAAFHDHVLALGSLPLATLRREMAPPGREGLVGGG